MELDRLLHVLRMRSRSLFGGGRLDRELDEELRDHLDRAIEANVARGLTPEAARRQALLALGGIEQRKEDCRDRRRTALIESVARDAGYALRTLGRAPAFTLAALITVALGIGATVAMFTIVNGVLLRPMPFPDESRLFLVALSPRSPFFPKPGMSDHNFVALRANNPIFQHVATFSTYDAGMVGAGDPAVITVARVGADFFAALGVAPLAGRTFHTTDDQPGREPIVVLSHHLWATRFGSDQTVIGRQVTIEGERREIVGVMPRDFNFPSKADAWTPHVVALQAGNSLMFPVLGRLKDGVTVAEARAQFDALLPDLPHRVDGDRDQWQIGLLPLKESLVADVRQPLQIFTGAVIFVLLIACANVANLLLARVLNRQREMEIRSALGASRSRLVRQLLTESTLLSLAGGLLAVLVAEWAVPALLALAPAGRIPRLDMIDVDARVVGFAFAASMMTGLMIGVMPALRATKRRAGSAMSWSGRPFGAGHERFRAVFVVAEIALALVLLAGAGLMIKSFLRLRAVDSGFDPKNVVTLNLDLPESVYSKTETRHAFHQSLLERLNALPNVESVGLVNWRPLGTMHLHGDFQVEGRGDPGFSVDKPTVSSGYFRAMGIRLVRGRDFDARDSASGEHVAIVSRTVAKALDPSEDAIGRRVTLRSRPRPEDWLTVVGVVDDVKQWGPQRETRPAIYQPYPQVTQAMALSHMSYIVRTTTDPQQVIPAIRTALSAVDRNQPATSIVSMEGVMASATAEPAFYMRLLGTLALIAVALAIVGTYGVLAYAVAQRTHEIGLRMALGARSRTVLWMVLRRTLVLSTIGIGLGLAGAALTTRLLTTFLFETPPTDAVTFASVAFAIFAAALIAGLIPARRATRVDPLVALRHE
jgi:putative ABC transport system permease protein